MKSTHSSRLERWLGADEAARLSQSMRGWYGPPIALAGVPGAVYATGDGDFVGECRAGWEMSALDRFRDLQRRVKRGFRFALDPRMRALCAGAGFSDLADLIAEGMTGGKRQDLFFKKQAENANTSGLGSSYWGRAWCPEAGSPASAAPGGDAPTSATTGALAFQNPPSGDQTHMVGYRVSNSYTSRQVLLYDRIFQVAKTMSSTATEAVTGVPTRYQSTTPGDDDYAAGNFMFPEVTSNLSTTGHNWDTCLYTDQDGNTGVTLPSCAGRSASSDDRLGFNLGEQWFFPLAAGDTGVKALTQMQCDASVSGGVDFVIGHPIAWITTLRSAIVCGVDGINTAFMLTRIFDDACLAFIEPAIQNAVAGNWDGHIQIVSG